MNTTKMYAKGLLMMASLGLMVSWKSKNTDSPKDYATTQTISNNEPRYKEEKGIPKGKYFIIALYVANKDYDVIVSDVNVTKRFISEDEKYMLLDAFEDDEREYEPDIIISDRKIFVFNSYAEASKARQRLMQGY